MPTEIPPPTPEDWAIDYILALARAIEPKDAIEILARRCHAAEEQLRQAVGLLRPFATFWTDTVEEVTISPGSMPGGIFDVADDARLPSFEDCRAAAAWLAANTTKEGNTDGR